MKKLKGLFITLLALLVFSFNANAQKNYLKDADKAFENNQYFNAIELYKQAYTKVKKKDVQARILYRTAEAYNEINDLKGAETYYQKAIKAKYPDPIATLRLADCLKSAAKYPEAIVEYNNYKKLDPSDSRADIGITSCELAQKWKDKQTRHVVANMALINSKESDFSPAFADKKYTTLFFTSTREGALGEQDKTTGQNHSDVYETKMDKNGKWATPTAMGQTLVSKFNDGAVAVSKKGDIMFITRCPEAKGKKLKCQLFVAKKQGPSWAEPELLPFNIDTVAFAHPTVSTDGKTLYFTSTLPGGYGGKDIWSSSYDAKAKAWGQPVNLGPTINTQGDEMYPFISEDGKLYFSSNYHIGMGGLDLFVAEKDASGKFSKAPENLKSPLNSAGDDFGIIFEGKKQRGYFTSNREGGKGNDDIWSFVLPDLKFNLNGTVASSKNGEPIENALVHLKGSDGALFEAKTGKDGKYSFKLKENVSYEVTVATDKGTTSTTFKEGFLANNDIGKFSTVGENESKDYQKDFALIPVEREIRFPAVLYDLAKSTLRPESKDSLNFLYQTLIDNPTITIELSAHTDSRGTPKSNDKLSQDRAQSCVDYLVNEKKIPAARLIAKGYGEGRLLIKDDVINKMKTKDEKEALHQKNRRTVFRILSWDFQDPNAPKKDKPVYKPQVKGEENVDDIEENEVK